MDWHNTLLGEQQHYHKRSMMGEVWEPSPKYYRVEAPRLCQPLALPSSEDTFKWESAVIQEDAHQQVFFPSLCQTLFEDPPTHFEDHDLWTSHQFFGGWAGNAATWASADFFSTLDYLIPPGSSPHSPRDDIIKHENTKEAVISRPLPVNDPSTSASAVFELKQHPHFKQRKSYASESRYILPNPVIGMRSSCKDGRKIIQGMVDVEMFCNGGGRSRSPTTVREKMVPGVPGGLQQPLILKDMCTQKFCLKVMENTSGDTFGLKFTVNFTTEDGEHHTEIILSDPFEVHSNVRGRKSPVLQE